MANALARNTILLRGNRARAAHKSSVSRGDGGLWGKQWPSLGRHGPAKEQAADRGDDERQEGKPRADKTHDGQNDSDRRHEACGPACYDELKGAILALASGEATATSRGEIAHARESRRTR